MQRVDQLWFISGRMSNENGEYLGSKQVGKDLVASTLVELLSEHYDCHILAFAGPLKQLTCNMYQLDATEMEAKKEAQLDELPNGWTYRRLLEVLGTNVVRSGLGLPDLWFRKLVESVRVLHSTPAQKAAQVVYGLSWRELLDEPDAPLDRLLQRTPRQLTQVVAAAMAREDLPQPPRKPLFIIVTDCRFPNEYHKGKELGAKVLQVHRIVSSSGTAQTPVNFHPSNQFYPEMVPDVTLMNNGTVEQLQQRVLEFAQSFR